MMPAQLNRSFRLGFAGTEPGVRDALVEFRGALAERGADPAHVADAELVIAEVLNNIVEHALTSDTPSRGRLECTMSAAGLDIEVIDVGRPMPGRAIPLTRMPSVDTARADLPEGGFGWALVRRLATRISYRRDPGLNRLSLHVPAPHDTRP